MLSRVRFEATDKTSEGVFDELLGAVEFVRESYGGEWIEGDGNESTVIIPAKDGYWGHMTIRVKE